MNEKSNLSQAPIVLVRFDDPDKKPLLYACGKCGQIHSPRIYACNDALAHETARRAAEDCYTCRTHNTCQHCGDQCEKGWLACDKCKRSKRFENSKEVPLDGVEECFGFDGGDFYRSPQDAAEDGEDWVYLCTFRHYSIDLERLEQDILDDHHEDASVHELKAFDALIAAVKFFNEAQTGGSFDEDRTRRARVAQLRDEEENSVRDASASRGKRFAANPHHNI